MTFLCLGFILFVNIFLKMNGTCNLEMIIQLSLKILIMNILKILIMKILNIPMMKTVKWSHMNPWVILPFLCYKMLFYLILMYLDVMKTYMISTIPKRNFSQILHL